MRYATPEEFAALADLDGASFGFVYSAPDLEDARLDVEPDGMLVAVDGERIIGASCEVPFTMTVPGGTTAALGLTWVSVEMTHRRKGVLRGLMDRQLRDAAGRGVPVVILTASEGGIYGRYGFGVATRTPQVVVDRRTTRLVSPPADHGVTRVTTEQARTVLPALYDRWRRETPGAVDRNETRWRLQLLDREHQREGMSALFHLVHDGGYVSYRIKQKWTDGDPQFTCWLTDYVINTPQAHAGLWQVLLRIDLVVTIESHRVPIDDPLAHLVNDPRQVRTTALNDGLWARPLDVSALLAARSYAVDTDVVLRVLDPLLGDTTVHLRGGPDGASCERTDDLPDVELGVAELGAIILGGARLTPLVRAGRVRADEPRTITRLDRAFLADISPQHGTYF